MTHSGNVSDSSFEIPSLTGVTPNGLAQIQAQVTDKLKKFEFGLRRKTEAGNESLSGSDQVPEGFPQPIEEYYQSLAKKQPLQQR